MLQQPSIPSTTQSGLTVTKPRLPAVRTTSRKMGESENHTYHFQDMKSIQCLTSMIGEVEEDTLALGLWHRRSHHTRPPCTDMSLATLWCRSCYLNIPGQMEPVLLLRAISSTEDVLIATRKSNMCYLGQCILTSYAPPRELPLIKSIPVVRMHLGW